MSEQQELMKAKQQEDDHEDNDAEMAEKQNGQTQQIIETGAVTPTGGKHVIHCLTIVGQVEGHYILPPQNKTTKYEHVIPQLVAIQESPDIKGLIMILNTVGGDVEAGLAIAELISGMKKPTVSLVLGGGHSIGVPLAVSARKSFIAPSATMTIHPVRMNGVVLGVPQTLSYFDKMQERIVRFVEQNSQITGREFRKLMMNTGELVMDVGTVLDGSQAVESGLIDRLGSLSEAVECLYDMIEQEEREKEAQEAREERRARPRPIRTPRQMTPADPRAVAQLQRNRGRRVWDSRRRSASYADSPAALLRAHSHLARALDEVRHRDGAGPHTMYQRMHSARSGQTAPAWNGGGEHCDVNPFGHPAPHAD